MFGIESILSYRTLDGMIFSTEEEAVEHQTKLMNEEADFTAYTTHGNLITAITEENTDDLLERATVIEVRNEAALNLLEAFFEYHGYVSPSELGWNIFDDDGWVTIEEFQQAMEAAYNIYPFKVKLVFEE